MWRLWFAIISLAAILSFAIFAMNNLEKESALIEECAENVISAGEAGDMKKAEEYHKEFYEHYEHLKALLTFTANHSDFNMAQLSYDRLWEYVQAGEFYEAKAELKSLKTSIVSLKTSESMKIEDIF